MWTAAGCAKSTTVRTRAPEPPGAPAETKLPPKGDEAPLISRYPTPSYVSVTHERQKRRDTSGAGQRRPAPNFVRA